jgi:SHS2 domain-containing protein
LRVNKAHDRLSIEYVSVEGCVWTGTIPLETDTVMCGKDQRAGASACDTKRAAATRGPKATVSVPGWEHFAHDADIGLCGWGATIAEAFERAGEALTAAVTDAAILPRTSVEVHCEAPDIELLFVEWLNAIIYEMAVQKVLFGGFTVRIDGERLQGTLWGEPVDVERHAPACEPKGATYTALKVAQSPDGLWSACCVVDV